MMSEAVAVESTVVTNVEPEDLVIKQSNYNNNNTSITTINLNL
jgi:hypothetical protein